MMIPFKSDWVIAQHFQISQMEIGPQMPVICGVVGFVIVPVAVAAWAYVIERRKSRQGNSRWSEFVVGIATLLLIAWLVLGIDVWFFEPHG